MRVMQEQTLSETGTEQCTSMTTYYIFSWGFKIKWYEELPLKAGNSDACLSGQAFKAYKK